MSHLIRTQNQLRTLYGDPDSVVWRKSITRIDGHCRRFISLSPFLVVATASREGPADASPRGDTPGFVTVLDDATLLIPDRPGNKRVDSMTNLVDNPRIGLIFMIPGINETLRVNGSATISTDPTLLDSFVVEGRKPISVIVVKVEEAFLHCAKAFMRSKLWDPTARVDRKQLPTLGKMIADQVAGVDPGLAEAAVQHSNRHELY